MDYVTIWRKDEEGHLPDHVRGILARYDEGLPLKDHELLTVQMVRNGGGCASCHHVGANRPNPASLN